SNSRALRSWSGCVAGRVAGRQRPHPTAVSTSPEAAPRGWNLVVRCRIYPARGHPGRRQRHRAWPDRDGRHTPSKAALETGLGILGNNQRYALAIHDPTPVRDVAGIWRSSVQSATIGIFLLLLIAFLYFCHALIVPILAAVVVGATFAPLIGK